jgi:hypothetical protein
VDWRIEDEDFARYSSTDWPHFGCMTDFDIFPCNSLCACHDDATGWENQDDEHQNEEDGDEDEDEGDDDDED